MSLSDLASIGSLVGGLAVVITLVFLSIQTRQTNKNQRSLMQQGQTEEGKKELESAKALIALNQREDQLQQKIAATPSDPHNLFELAQLYKKMGNYASAETWFQNTLKLSPRYPNADSELAEVRRLAKKPAR